MAHERTYSDDDRHLARLREVALRLPEATEVEAWGRPTFRAGPKKMFAMFLRQDEHGFAVAFKPDAEDRPALVADELRFYSPPYLGPSGWLALDLDAAPVDWDEVAELVESSYRQVALERMLRALDDR